MNNNNEKLNSIVDGSLLSMTEIKKRLNLMGVKYNSIKNDKKYFIKIYNNNVKIEQNQNKILDILKKDEYLKFNNFSNSKRKKFNRKFSNNKSNQKNHEPFFNNNNFHIKNLNFKNETNNNNLNNNSFQIFQTNNKNIIQSQIYTKNNNENNKNIFNESFEINNSIISANNNNNNNNFFNIHRINLRSLSENRLENNNYKPKSYIEFVHKISSALKTLSIKKKNRKKRFSSPIIKMTHLKLNYFDNENNSLNNSNFLNKSFNYNLISRNNFNNEINNFNYKDDKSSLFGQNNFNINNNNIIFFNNKNNFNNEIINNNFYNFNNNNNKENF